jgi:Spy/CpxP family protein refolding chaperone
VKRVAAALLGILLSSVLAAQGIDGKWWKRPRIARELQLSADQTADLEKIFARSKPKLIDLRADLEKKQFAYDQAMLEDDVDRKAIETMIEAREDARAALQKELSLMQLDMKQVLKPDQRERLIKMREAARALQQQRRRRLRDETMDDEAAQDAPRPGGRGARATPRPPR